MLFRYLAARWRHPGPSAQRYIRAGLGLEFRARSLSTFWTDHFSRTRAAQARWARTVEGDVLTVLGAGPLLDFNSAALSLRFRNFRLVDANPLVVPDWSRLNKPVIPVVTDITNCLVSWQKKLKDFSGSWEQAMTLLRDLAQVPVPAYSSPTDALLSLNILSQLDVSWQEAVEPILQKRFGRRFVGQHEHNWLNAIQPTSRILVEQHLGSLEASGARDILLISDVEYVEYKGRQYSSYQWEAPPLRWTESGWRAEAGIQFEVIPALEGIMLDQPTFTRWLPSYVLQWHESWLWHISPKGTETDEYGKLHRVGAFALRHRDSVSA